MSGLQPDGENLPHIDDYEYSSLALNTNNPEPSIENDSIQFSNDGEEIHNVSIVVTIVAAFPAGNTLTK